MNKTKTNPAIVLESLFAALADRTRLRLLNLMSDGEICVCYFTVVLGESQPKVSRHLAYLRRAGLVRARRDGKWMHYSIVEPSEPAARAVYDSTIAALRDDPAMRRERGVLSNVCCAVPPPPELEGAPRPAFVQIALPVKKRE